MQATVLGFSITLPQTQPQLTPSMIHSSHSSLSDLLKCAFNYVTTLLQCGCHLPEKEIQIPQTSKAQFELLSTFSLSSSLSCFLFAFHHQNMPSQLFRDFILPSAQNTLGFWFLCLAGSCLSLRFQLLKAILERPPLITYS